MQTFKFFRRAITLPPLCMPFGNFPYPLYKRKDTDKSERGPHYRGA